MNNFLKYVICLLILFYGCKQNNYIHSFQLKPITKPTIIAKKSISELEKYFISKKLINIHSLDTSIRVSLAYSTTQNFLHKIIYDNLQQCYLPCDVAIKLCNSHYYLKQCYPNYNIRPLS